MLLSVDVPAKIAGIDVEPADVLRLSDGLFTLFFDASSASPPIPSSTNVVGIDKATPLLLLSFDIPTNLDGVIARPLLRSRSI